MTTPTMLQELRRQVIERAVRIACFSCAMDPYAPLTTLTTDDMMHTIANVNANCSRSGRRTCNMYWTLQENLNFTISSQVPHVLCLIKHNTSGVVEEMWIVHCSL